MGSIRESFSSGISFQYISVISMFLSSSIFYFFLAHLLPVSTVGSISLLYAIISIATTVFVFGLGYGIQHYFSYHLTRNNSATLLKLIEKTVIFGFLLSITAFIVLYYLSNFIAVTFFHNIYYELYIKIIAVAISGTVIVNIFSSMLLGLNQYRKYSIIYIFVYIFTYFFPLSLLVIYGKPIYLVEGIAIINIASALIFGLFILRYYRMFDSGSGTETEPYKHIIYYSIPLFFSTVIGTSATYIDRIVVSYFVNLSYLGIYNFALIISGAAPLLVSPVSNLLLPKLSSFFSMDNKTAFRSSIRILLNMVSLIYIPSALGIAALSRQILDVFAGILYVQAYIPLMLIMFVTSLFIGGTILTSGISSIRQTRIYIISSSLSLLSNLILSIILIPRFSIIGAAISYSSMTAVNFAVIYYYARKFGIANYDGLRIFKIWVASLIMFGMVFLLQGHMPYGILSILVCVLFGLIIYVVEIKAFRLINTEEMGYALSVLPDRFSVIKHIIGGLAYHEKGIFGDKKLRAYK